MDGKELIVIDQLPVIREKLASIKAEIDTKVKNALAAPCTEETCAKVKKDRAALNKAYIELEERRKEVKRTVLAPYEEFEAVYNEYIKDSFMPALKTLDERIATVTNAVKAEKTGAVKRYFEEYRESVGLYFLSFSDLGLKVTQSVSEKKLKEEAKAFVDRVVEDVAAISVQDCSSEILAEYEARGENFLNAAKAIAAVSERHKRIQEAAAQQAAAQEAKAKEAEPQEAPDEAADTAPLSAPVVLPEEPDQPAKPAAAAAMEQVDRIIQNTVLQVTFTVYGTREKLRALKAFLVEGGYQYE